MKNIIVKSAAAAVVAYALCLPTLALAGTWEVKEDPMGPGYIVTDNETGTIHTQGKRAANKIAKILNKADEGVVDAPNSPCHDPSTGVVC